MPTRPKNKKPTPFSEIVDSPGCWDELCYCNAGDWAVCEQARKYKKQYRERWCAYIDSLKKSAETLNDKNKSV
jgi:hypothetical protein